MSIDKDLLKDALQNHMEAQPYKITCGVCGDQLDCDVIVDSDFDLNITVHGCKTCTENAYNEGYYA